MKISPKETNISSIFASNFLTIPRFQRPYSWDKENIQDFWDDVSKSRVNEYFFGSMVFHRTSESSTNVHVVDGQQRLTTTTIFFCVLRDVLISLGETNLAQGLQQIVERRNINNEMSFTLNSQDPYPFFQDHIQKLGSAELKTPLGDGEKSLKNCYDHLHQCVLEHVEGLAKNKKIKSITELRDKSLSIKVITVELDNEDDAYYIFETLNTRGKEFGVSDLVKNHILRFLRVKGAIDTTREKWNYIQRTIGHSNSDISLNTFIVHHWISKFEYLPERKLFQSMRKVLSNTALVKSYFDNINEEVAIYRGIFEPNFISWTKEQKEISVTLRAFSIFRLRQAAPFALAILAEHTGGRISIKNTIRFLRAIENFHFKFTAVTSQRGAGGVAKMYSRASRELRNATDENEKRKICMDMISRFEAMQPDEIEFQLGFVALLYSKEFTSQRALVRYVLERIHRHFNGNSHIDYDQMTIEHILPQSADIDEETKASIGNLVFVTRETNEKLKNKNFKEKRDILAASGHEYDSSILNAKKWGPTEIESRYLALSKIAYNEIWKI